MYIVYQVTLPESGEVVYIGSGKPNRTSHVNSMRSSSQHLNIESVLRSHYGMPEMVVEVIHNFETKAEAIAKEDELIKELKPAFNVMRPSLSAEDYKQYHKEYAQKHKERRNAASREHRQNNKEEIKAKRRIYNQANKERIALANKLWYEANKEERNKKSREFYENNKDKILQQSKLRYEANKEEILARMRETYHNKKALQQAPFI